MTTPTVPAGGTQEKIILDLCGGTGSWSAPYREAGYDVRLVTLPDNDVRSFSPPPNVYGILAAPPCTMFSFARTKAKNPRNLKEGMECVRACLDIIWKCNEVVQNTGKKTLPLKFWALENPARGFLKDFLGRPVFVFNPYDFGDNYKKETAIWGNFNQPFPNDEPLRSRNLPKFDKLKTREIHPERYGELNRTERRSITPAGFAKAFFEANQ